MVHHLYASLKLKDKFPLAIHRHKVYLYEMLILCVNIKLASQQTLFGP